MRISLSLPVLVVLVLSLPSPGAAQSDFQWSGRLSPGQRIKVKGVNGDVRAVASSSDAVDVTATRSARRSNPLDVRIEVVPHAGGVTICAVYPTPPGGEPNECVPGTGGRVDVRNNDTVVHFVVHVPSGVGFFGQTVNGQVIGESLQGDVEAHAVNGSVRLSTTGRALASTVNGSVEARMGRTDWSSGGHFTTVNGNITLTMPGPFDANIRAEMMHGTLTSDFPVNVTSTTGGPDLAGSTRQLRGTIGRGGRELDLTTVNGSIRLRRAS